MNESLEKLHRNFLSLLKDFDSICIKNGINYSLFAGTLIGAIRHQGFIPWDDDVDVIMERKEYEKFVKALPSEYEIIREKWVPRFKKKKSELFFDLFIMDKASESPLKQKLLELRIKFMQGTLKDGLSLKQGNLVNKILSIGTYIVGKPFDTKTKIKVYDRLAQTHNNLKSDFVFTPYCSFKYLHHVLPKFIIEKYERVQFEDTELMIMAGYHKYLSEFYGDYMKLPPEEERIPVHGVRM